MSCEVARLSRRTIASCEERRSLPRKAWKKYVSKNKSWIICFSLNHFFYDPITGPDGASPFPSNGYKSSTAFRYKKFELLNYNVICRCRFDAYDDNRDPAMIFMTSQHNPRNVISLFLFPIENLLCDTLS